MPGVFQLHCASPYNLPHPIMNGAESLVRTLIASEVNVCFTNPGTSEMHFVAALDKIEGMRCVLGLFEGVVTGAADGYFRMTGRPASTLLHLGPGPRQRPGQPAQRQEGALRHRQHRRRACQLPPQVRRAADLRHRRHCAADVALDQDIAVVAGHRRRRRARGRSRARRTGADRDADPARRYGVERRHRAGDSAARHLRAARYRAMPCVLRLPLSGNPTPRS